MKQIFGHDIARVFYPLEDNAPVSLPSQTPTIYVFDFKPDLTTAAAGTGAIATVSTWTQDTASPYGCSYTIPAINDPQPTSATNYKEYWEALNFYAKTGADIAPVLREFTLYRIEGHESIPGTTSSDLIAIYPALTAYLSTAQLTQFIATAQDDLKIDLKISGHEWSKIHDLSELKLALAYKAIALCALSQIREAGDRFEIRYREFKDKYTTIIQNLKLPYDADADGEAEAPTALKRSYWITAR